MGRAYSSRDYNPWLQNEACLRHYQLLFHTQSLVEATHFVATDFSPLFSSVVLIFRTYQLPDSLNMKDLFSGHAANYVQYRPTYPPELFSWLINQVNDTTAAWDCGTGNGQVAAVLADFLHRYMLLTSVRSK